MFIIYIAFAYWAFLIASNIFKRFWAWLASGVAVGVITAIAVNADQLNAVIAIVVILAILTVILLIARKRK